MYYYHFNLEAYKEGEVFGYEEDFFIVHDNIAILMPWATFILRVTIVLSDLIVKALYPENSE